METDPTRMCELLVGLPDVNVLGVEGDAGVMLSVVVETKVVGPVGCPGCGSFATPQAIDGPVLTPLRGICGRDGWNHFRPGGLIASR